MNSGALPAVHPVAGPCDTEYSLAKGRVKPYTASPFFS